MLRRKRLVHLDQRYEHSRRKSSSIAFSNRRFAPRSASPLVTAAGFGQYPRDSGNQVRKKTEEFIIGARRRDQPFSGYSYGWSAEGTAFEVGRALDVEGGNHGY